MTQTKFSNKGRELAEKLMDLTVEEAKQFIDTIEQNRIAISIFPPNARVLLSANHEAQDQDAKQAWRE